MNDKSRNYAAPVSGFSVARSRLAHLFDLLDSQLVVLSAAGGWGKTATAMQFAASKRFTRVYWLSLYRRCCDEEGLMAEVLHALGESHDRSILLPRETAGEMRDRLAVRFAADAAHSVCLVLDDADLTGTMSVVASLSHMLKEIAGVGSSVVVTSRSRLDAQRDELQGAWVIESEDLMLSLEEAREILSAMRRDSIDEEQTRRLLDAARGHVALFSVLARHPQYLSGQQARMPLDLHAMLLGLAKTSLSAEGRKLLHAAALLTNGSIDELMSVAQAHSLAEVSKVAGTVPLLRLPSASSWDSLFVLHDLAVSAYSSPENLGLADDASAPIRAAALEVLCQKQEYGRLFDLVEHDRAQSLVWLERCMDGLLHHGDMHLLGKLYARVPPEALIMNPVLLIGLASHLRQSGRLHEALEKAMVAKDLASVERDERTYLDALLLLSRIEIDLGDFRRVREHLDELVEHERSLTADDRALCYTFLAVAQAQSGSIQECERILANAASSARTRGLSGAVEAHATLLASTIRGQMGDWVEAISALSAVANSRTLPAAIRLHAMGNLGCALCETGRIARAEKVMAATLEECSGRGLSLLGDAFRGVEAGLLAARGDYSGAESTMTAAIRGSLASGDEYETAYNRVYSSVMLRASGNLDGSLEEAERACEEAAHLDLPMIEWLTGLEWAASMLALGDGAAARVRAEGVRSRLWPSGAKYHTLRADLILAECSRRNGRTEEAIGRLLEHEEYILTESSNWQVAMYIRAFPGLLGIFAEAIGPDRLPAHLVRMVLPQDAEEALRMAMPTMRPSSWRKLSVRLVGEDRTEQLMGGDGDGPSCRVRLFGGLEVRTERGLISDKAWRKRKARQLFAMLVVRQGRDVPRELLLECLWPEMTAERGRNNFYVVWNAMKSALMAGEGKGVPCPYVEAVGGVCRTLSAAVRSDLDDFEQLVAEGQAADADGDVERALAAYIRLPEVYTGELLPGDVYDDWFAALRERCKQSFGDGMLRATELLMKARNPTRALQMVRHGLAQDPWREDLYRAGIRCQIDIGHRSSAIDMYFTCRQRLSDDLGLDLSVETRRLYDQVLAMEDPQMYDDRDPEPEVA